MEAQKRFQSFPLLYISVDFKGDKIGLVWSGVLVWCFGLVFWSGVLVWCSGLVFWSGVLVWCSGVHES